MQIPGIKGITNKSMFCSPDVSEGREHDCMDAGGRAMPGAIAEERKLRLHGCR